MYMDWASTDYTLSARHLLAEARRYNRAADARDRALIGVLRGDVRFAVRAMNLRPDLVAMTSRRVADHGSDHATGPRSGGPVSEWSMVHSGGPYDRTADHHGGPRSTGPDHADGPWSTGPRDRTTRPDHGPSDWTMVHRTGIGVDHGGPVSAPTGGADGSVDRTTADRQIVHRLDRIWHELGRDAMDRIADDIAWVDRRPWLDDPTVTREGDLPSTLLARCEDPGDRETANGYEGDSQLEDVAFHHTRIVDVLWNEDSTGDDNPARLRPRRNTTHH